MLRLWQMTATTCSLKTREKEEESSRDQELRRVRSAIRSSKSRDLPEKYRHLYGKHATTRYIILRGCRIVIPRRSRHRLLALAHEKHQGIATYKARLWSKVWWPRVDHDIERACCTCRECQITYLANQAPPMTRTTLPSAPWVSITADLLVLSSTGDHLLVVADYYSRFNKVEIMRSIRAQDVIRFLETMITRYGAPYRIQTDNQGKIHRGLHGLQPLFSNRHGSIISHNYIRKE